MRTFPRGWCFQIAQNPTLATDRADIKRGIGLGHTRAAEASMHMTLPAWTNKHIGVQLCSVIPAVNLVWWSFCLFISFIQLGSSSPVENGIKSKTIKKKAPCASHRYSWW